MKTKMPDYIKVTKITAAVRELHSRSVTRHRHARYAVEAHDQRVFLIENTSDGSYRAPSRWLVTDLATGKGNAITKKLDDAVAWAVRKIEAQERARWEAIFAPR